jgi:mannobiose 2-epimerase
MQKVNNLMKVRSAFNVLDVQALERECHKIADWWMAHSIDSLHGGFVGEIDAKSNPVISANKGIILNARILWFFSEAAKEFKNAQYAEVAERAYGYLMQYFDDGIHGGVCWELDYQGQCINSKKQSYAQAFAIYGLSAYYRLTGDKRALAKALHYFDLLEQHAVDLQHGGYFEAFTQDWRPVDDMRLSDKDLNYPKSMNTHLHIIEAYTALYAVSGKPQVAAALESLLLVFEQHIVLKPSLHLSLFQSHDWQDCSPAFSFGHDIECSWLLWEAVEVLNQPQISAQFRPLVLKMATVCLEQAIGERGQVCDQLTFADQKIHQDSFWWVQAEAIIGFLQAFQLSGLPKFKQAAEKVWQFTQEQHIDREYGEWSWLALCDQPSKDSTYKAGFWKGPYHNGRAMMVAARLLRDMEQEILHEMAK